MVNPYLNIFLKKQNIRVIETVFYGGNMIKGGAQEPVTTSVAGSIVKGDQMLRKGVEGIGSGLVKGIKTVTKGAAYGTAALVGAVPYALYKGVKHGIINPLTKTSPEHALARKIVISIQNALGEITKSQKVIQEDIEKIQRLTIPNQIDLNYGGGILIFDGDFNIIQTMYFCYQNGETPVYMNEPIDTSNTENDFLNQLLAEEHPPYASKPITIELLSVLHI